MGIVHPFHADEQQARALTQKALERELDLEQWRAAVAPLMQSLGRARPVFDQRNQRVTIQFNVQDLAVRQPLDPRGPPPEALQEQEAALRQRVRERFCEEAPYYVPLSGETTEVCGQDAARGPRRSVRRRRQRLRAEYREWIREGREIRRVRLATFSEGVDKYPCIILLGDPGFFCRRIASESIP